MLVPTDVPTGALAPALAPAFAFWPSYHSQEFGQVSGLDVSPRPPPVPTLSEQKEVLTLCKELTAMKLLSYKQNLETALTDVSLFLAEFGGVTRTFAGTFCP